MFIVISFGIFFRRCYFLLMNIEVDEIVLSGFPSTCCWEPAIPGFYRIRAVKLLLLDFIVPLAGWEEAFSGVN